MQRFREICGFDDRLLLWLGIPFASLLMSLLVFHELVTAGDWADFLICMPISLAYTALYWFSLRWFYGRLRLRFPAASDLRKRLLGVFLAFLALYIVIKILIDDFIVDRLFDDHPDPGFIVEFVSILLLSSLVISIYEASSFSFQLQGAMTEKANLERHYVQSQLEGLRNQVNPHFLFNSLNTLIYLIPEDSDKAVRFVQQLSKVYRFVLESRDAKVIPLGEELEFLQSYIFLQKERFGDNLKVEIGNLEERKNKTIVPLSLQLLFENAIKHNVISTEKPLKIEVFAENGHLVVRNNLQKKNQVMESTGVGLQNIKDRYRLVSDRAVEVIVTPQSFIVALPLLAN
jgi:two-component system, LytTR family, sensor kinase